MAINGYFFNAVPHAPLRPAPMSRIARELLVATALAYGGFALVTWAVMALLG